jgi:hypothetical protein
MITSVRRRLIDGAGVSFRDLKRVAGHAVFDETSLNAKIIMVDDEETNMQLWSGCSCRSSNRRAEHEGLAPLGRTQPGVPRV